MSGAESSLFDDLLEEDREFLPPAQFAAGAIINDESLYALAEKDNVKYWETQADQLHWFKRWTKPFSWDPPHCKWFEGGKINITYNCLDRHLRGAARNKAALIWEAENGTRKTYTYLQLYREVCLFANSLKELGVKKGDRIAIYLPMVPEAAIAMLACARIGAIHSVVFGGFSPESLAWIPIWRIRLTNIYFSVIFSHACW